MICVVFNETRKERKIPHITTTVIAIDCEKKVSKKVCTRKDEKTDTNVHTCGT